MKDLKYYKDNCEEDYLHTPISVLRYITELEKEVESKPLIESQAEEIERLTKELNELKTPVKRCSCGLSNGQHWVWCEINNNELKNK